MAKRVARRRAAACAPHLPERGDDGRYRCACGHVFEGCAWGPCATSAARGGPGCRLCDVIATLPQGGDVPDIRLHDARNPLRDGLADPLKKGPITPATTAARIGQADFRS